MYNFSKQIVKFHNEHVTLTMALREEMKGRRDKNKQRIIDGLAELDKAPPVDWINQGGYAQQTMTQPPEGDEESRYDIDMGVVFADKQTKTALTTKGWVRDAIARKASSMKYDPECKPKCVRVVYAAGYQCDFPVFRVDQDSQGTHELAAGDEWIGSDPRAMNAWINDQVVTLSPSGNGISQPRQIIRLIKYFSKVKSYKKARKYPSGLVATAIAIESYKSSEGRLDYSFGETLRAISNRSKHQAVFANGIQISDEKDVSRIERLINCAGDAVAHLDSVDEEGGDREASIAWKKIFHHSFFDPIETKSAKSKTSAFSAVAATTFGITSAEQAARASSAAEQLRRSDLASKPFASNEETDGS